jgi:hypothetical protein
MGPYREFLASAKAARTLYRNLTQSNPSFSDYLEKTQMSAREKAKDTGGFIDFLAEPFQRAPRYQLLIAGESHLSTLWGCYTDDAVACRDPTTPTSDRRKRRGPTTGLCPPQ